MVQDVTILHRLRPVFMPEFTTDDITSLAAKLDALELTDGERAALDAAFDAAAAADDVAGFSAETASYANQEVSYFLPRLGAILFFDEADAVRNFIGETEKNLRS